VKVAPPPAPSFAQVEAVQRKRHGAAILRAEAQTEAARELLEAAIQRDPTTTDFWTRAVDFADAEEAAARRAFARWQERDRFADWRAFRFRRALENKTANRLADSEIAAPQLRMQS